MRAVDNGVRIENRRYRRMERHKPCVPVLQEIVRVGEPTRDLRTIARRNEAAVDALREVIIRQQEVARSPLVTRSTLVG